MAVSAASLLQVEYPFTTDDDYKRSSYPRLAEELKRIGAPKENLVELFGRMIFNALVGNDDDHPRNHAVIFDIESNRWCLSPAFDVVPNPDEHPKFLVMQVSTGRRDINREAILADFSRFGFAEKAQAERYLDTLISKIVDSFPKIKILLNEKLSKLMTERLQLTLSILGPPERADLTTWF